MIIIKTFVNIRTVHNKKTDKKRVNPGIYGMKHVSDKLI
jgi:hypothetical protein